MGERAGVTVGYRGQADVTRCKDIAYSGINRPGKPGLNRPHFGVARNGGCKACDEQAWWSGGDCGAVLPHGWALAGAMPGGIASARRALRGSQSNPPGVLISKGVERRRFELPTPTLRT